MKKTVVSFLIGIGAISLSLIIILATGLWKQVFYSEADEEVKTRIVTPQETNVYSDTGQTGETLLAENLITKIPMEEGETVIAVMNKESEEGLAEEQFVLFRNTADAGSVYITFFNFDERTRAYRRAWDSPVAASRPETISLFSQDLIGDRNNCIIVTGMNSNNEHTINIFRRSPYQRQEQAFRKILELQIEGSIVIQEANRSIAYQQGIARGQSYNIAAYGHDVMSNNILDQIETIYSYNTVSEQYEQMSVSRIPGSQVEQRRIRELLSGTPGVFENFINDLWYYVSPQGTIDTRQYIYFDSGRQIIFSGDEAQQVYRWLSSQPTRFGLYVTSQNVSISTLRRRIDIDLESLDSIRLRVHDDIRLKITVTESWDGSYRRAGAFSVKEPYSQIKTGVDAVYDSSWGRLELSGTGEYSINTRGAIKKGRYVFYKIDSTDLIEMRGEESDASNSRQVYKIENAAGSLILSRVRVGSNGVQDMLEPPVTLTPVN